MPEIGDERRMGSWHGVSVWVACPECGYSRWVQRNATQRIGYTGQCRTCCLAANKNSNRMYFEGSGEVKSS